LAQEIVKGGQISRTKAASFASAQERAHTLTVSGRNEAAPSTRRTYEPTGRDTMSAADTNRHDPTNDILVLVSVSYYQIKFICDKNKHNVTHTKKTKQVCRQDTKAA